MTVNLDAAVSADLAPVPPGVVRIVHLQEEGRIQKGDAVETAENGRCTVVYVRAHDSLMVRNAQGGMIELSGINFGGEAVVVDRSHDRPRG